MAPPKSKKSAAVKKPQSPASSGGRASARRPRKSAPRSLYSPAEVHEIFRRFSVQRPEPKGELDYVNAFTLLVAVVLSAQATDAGVNKATKALFATADTPAKMLALGEAKVGDYIRTIGLWRNKAKNVIALSKALIDDYAGQVPQERDELVKLPGVGRKTANVVMNCAFGAETFAVDTHIFRVGNRTGIAKGKTVLAVEKQLEKRVPQPFRVGSHHWMILHGRYICKARAPECWRCPVIDLCDFKAKNLNQPKKAKSTKAAA